MGRAVAESSRCLDDRSPAQREYWRISDRVRLRWTKGGAAAFRNRVSCRQAASAEQETRLSRLPARNRASQNCAATRYELRSRPGRGRRVTLPDSVWGGK